MAKRLFTNCNIAIVEAAMMQGCRFFCGYPLTPTTEALEHASRRFPETGRVFVQAESELSAISMLGGAAAVGERGMTATSGVGFALMQEGLSNLAGMAQFPTVIYLAQRGGPGMGRLYPNQGDYRIATRGGGAGDYRCIVLGPETVQEAVDLTKLAFVLADRYRTPAILLADQMLAGTTTSYALGDPLPEEPVQKDYILEGARGRIGRYVGRPGYTNPKEPNYLSMVTPNLLGMDEDPDGYSYERHMLDLFEKYARIEASEVRAEQDRVEDAELVIVAYGSSALLMRPVVEQARARGLKVGLIRPITLFPFPKQLLNDTAGRVRDFLVVEMSFGQMADDVRLAVLDRGARVHDFQTHGGAIPRPERVLPVVETLLEQAVQRRAG
ncbi:MAG: 3-methyl-2-oxobutanoate dehydrogenase subunit beta [Gammaproteobacteria bacterium]